MANTKISSFPQVLNNDIRQMTSIAGAGNTLSANNVNVKISGSSLLNSLEALLDLSSFSTGTLPVLRGGTGATSFTTNGVLIGNASNAISATAELADGELLIGSAGNAHVPATLTAGTGITVTNGSGSITIANSAPDQTVALTGGTGISTSGTYPNFTITNNAPDQTVALTGGAGISTSGTYPNFTITNDSPNQATPAAGSSGQLQYNDGSNGFAATSDMVYTTDQLKVQNSIYLDGNGSDAGIVKLGCESAGASHYVGLEGPTHAGSNSYIIKFPDPDPSVGKILKVSSFSFDKAVMEWADDNNTDTSIYAADGSLTGARTVTMGANNLTFASTTAGQEVKFEKNVRIDGQSYTPLETISSTNSWTPDWDSGNVQTMELTAATTINDPSNIEVGATYIIILKQDGDGSHTVTWGNAYNFPSATAPTLTTGANKADVITLVAYSSAVLMCTSVLDFETT